MNLHDRVVMVQIDNLGIMPFHSVKASGKSLPMVSGTATQSIVQSRKRKRTFQDNQSTPTVRIALDNWLDPKRTLLSLAAFVSSFNSPTDQCILNDFYDVVFGISYQNRDRLLGSSGERATYNRGQREILYKH